ncbi:MAG: hypothetical protein V4537_14625 [Pseudomonadota bacterium]
MATRKVTYASASTITCTLASLATSSGLTVGRDATEIDNTTNLYLDAWISGKISVGTTPTANTRIEIWVIPRFNDSTYPDTFGSTDAGVTVTSRAAALAAGKLLAVIDVDVNTSNRAYYFGNSLSNAGFLTHPAKFNLWIVHNTGVNLNATGGNHELDYKGSYETIA